MRSLLLLATRTLAARVVVDEIAATALRVDERYVSTVLDPSSLDCGASRNQFSDPRGAGLANLTNAKLRRFVQGISPTLIVITGGRANCLDAKGKKAWRSPYCLARGYGGASDQVLPALDAFSRATGADLAWHVNPSFRDAYGRFDAAAAPAPTKATALLLYEELHERPPRPSKQKLPVSNGAQASPQSLALDFELLRKKHRDATVVGMLNQDNDQPAAWTDAVYDASKSSVDVVAFSYYASSVYLSKARKRYGCGAYADVPAGIVDPSHRKPFERILERYVALARRLGKVCWLVAAAPCTHSPEGSGWGAVDAVAGGLWYADLLGRAAAGGAKLFARQTLLGGVYGLLDSRTYAETPSAVVAKAFSEHFGPEVLTVTAQTPPTLSVFAHCGRGAGTVAFLIVNVGNRTESLILPRHGAGPVVISLAGDALAAPAFAPSKLEARDSNAPLRIPAFSATVAIVGRLERPPATCRRAAATPPPAAAEHRRKKRQKHGWFAR